MHVASPEPKVHASSRNEPRQQKPDVGSLRDARAGKRENDREEDDEREREENKTEGRGRQTKR